MSEKKPAIAVRDLPDGWPGIVRKIILRDGHAIRAHRSQFSIEVKSLTTNEWCLLALPGGGTTFTTAEGRDQLLSILEGK